LKHLGMPCETEEIGAGYDEACGLRDSFDS
jgi:hypothetical protein